MVLFPHLIQIIIKLIKTSLTFSLGSIFILYVYHWGICSHRIKWVATHIVKKEFFFIWILCIVSFMSFVLYSFNSCFIFFIMFFFLNFSLVFRIFSSFLWCASFLFLFLYFLCNSLLQVAFLFQWNHPLLICISSAFVVSSSLSSFSLI